MFNAPAAKLPDAKELVIRLPGSKTNQLNQDVAGNQLAAGVSPCLVEALAEVSRHFPERFAATHAESPRDLFLRKSGRAGRRADLRRAWRATASHQGYDPKMAGTWPVRRAAHAGAFPW